MKLRGYRIELGEIEAALKSHPQLQDAVVLLSEDLLTRRNWLPMSWAFKEQDGSIEQLRRFLRRVALRLHGTCSLHALGALAEPPTARWTCVCPFPPDQRETTHHFVAPRTPLEEMLATIWSRVLGVEPVGIYDDFFALGGESIRSIQILSHGS